MTLFLLSVIQPFYVVIGGLTLGPYRLFLFLAAIPVFLAFAKGKAGRVIFPDFLFVFYGAWLMVSVQVNHGLGERGPFAIAQVVETIVPYFLARVMIRDVASFRHFVRVFAWIVVFLLPFAVLESLTEIKLFLRFYDALPGVNAFDPVLHEQRLGLYRAQTAFEHPILFGVFCATSFALVWCALPRAKIARMAQAGVTVLCVFFSLSSGALFTVLIQGAFLSWDFVLTRLRSRWKLLIVLAVLGYVALDFMIESNPILFFISKATLNAGSAWNRVLIWDYGTVSVANNPVFGIAYHEWVRPSWMLGSVDNYWLLIAMRYGLPAFVSFVLATLWICLRGARRDFSNDPDAAACRAGFLISLAGVSLALATVFVWSGTYALFMFLIGSGAWFMTAPISATPAEAPDDADETAPVHDPAPVVRYNRSATDLQKHTRFPPNNTARPRKH